MHGSNATRNVRLGAFVAACALATQGCSAIFVRPPTSPATGGPPRCTESRAAPIADTVVAGVAAAFLVPSLQAALTCSPNCAENAGPGLSVLSGAVLLGTAASAIYGFHQTSRCTEARTSWCSSHDCGSEAPDAGLRSELKSTRPARAGEGAGDTVRPRSGSR